MGSLEFTKWFQIGYLNTQDIKSGQLKDIIFIICTRKMIRFKFINAVDFELENIVDPSSGIPIGLSLFCIIQLTFMKFHLLMQQELYFNLNS